MSATATPTPDQATYRLYRQSFDQGVSRAFIVETDEHGTLPKRLPFHVAIHDQAFSDDMRWSSIAPDASGTLDEMIEQLRDSETAWAYTLNGLEYNPRTHLHGIKRNLIDTIRRMVAAGIPADRIANSFGGMTAEQVAAVAVPVTAPDTPDQAAANHIHNVAEEHTAYLEACAAEEAEDYIAAREAAAEMTTCPVCKRQYAATGRSIHYCHPSHEYIAHFDNAQVGVGYPSYIRAEEALDDHCWWLNEAGLVGELVSTEPEPSLLTALETELRERNRDMARRLGMVSAGIRPETPAPVGISLDIEQPRELFYQLWHDEGYTMKAPEPCAPDYQLSLFTVDVCAACQRILIPRPFSKKGSYRLFAYCETCDKATEV